jgi:hypothetical protein
MKTRQHQRGWKFGIALSFFSSSFFGGLKESVVKKGLRPDATFANSPSKKIGEERKRSEFLGRKKNSGFF